jgi:hypothetical protein
MPMLLALAAFAAAATAPKPGAVKTFKDWTVACDNVQSCTAEGLMPEDGDYDDAVVLILQRTGTAGATITIEADTGSAKGAAQLLVDGSVIQSLGSVNGNGLKATLTLATLAKMAQGTRVELRVGGKSAGTTSLAGFSAAMRYWDAEQRRDGTAGAVVAKGSATRTIAPPAAPRIAAARVPVTKAPAPSKTLVAMLAKKFGCEDEQDNSPMPAEAYPLGGGRTLIFLPCGAGAYNFSSKPVIASGKSYALALFDLKPDWSGEDDAQPILVNAGFDPKTAILSSYSKGRGPGDCGTAQDWVWDGTRFRLTEMREMDECRGSIAWMRTWTATVAR